MILAIFFLIEPIMTRFFTRWSWLLLFPLVAAIHCRKQQPQPADAATLQDSVILSGLSHPWALELDQENHLWITERGGRISRLNLANGNHQPILTISEVDARGEGGLLDMALHPNFAQNGWLYVVYNYASPSGYREKLVRFTWNPTNQNLESPTTLLENIPAATIHNGSRLLINGSHIFMSTGDAANPSLAQDPQSLAGKILRLNLDGSVPNDNPIPNNPLWTLGHRNPQGLVFYNNNLYSSEHGPNNDDEINVIEKGRNYGWPQVEGYCDEAGEENFCSSNNVREPIQAWTPTIATCGLAAYNSDRIPQWKNSLLIATLKNQRLYQLKLNAQGTAVEEVKEYYTSQYGRLRDVIVSADGKVYLCSSNGNNDRIILIDKTSNP
jgi:glucose/arabinose dehydrogenase